MLTTSCHLHFCNLPFTKKTMKRILCLSLLLLSLTSLELFAQPRGRALYDILSTERVTNTTGTYSVNWLPGGQGYYVQERDSVTSKMTYYRIDPRTQARSPFFDEETQGNLIQAYNSITGENVDELPFQRFNLVRDGDGMTFSTDERHFFFDFQSDTLRELLRPEVERQPNTDGLMRNMIASQLWNGEYSPDFNRFAYVKEYDLYVVDTVTGKEKRLTFDGNENLFNGRPNWVYPEEFSQLTAYWWSPDSRLLAYVQYDEAEVHKYPIIHDLDPEAQLESQSYPKAGETNPTARLFIVDTDTGKQVEVQTDSSSEIYIVRTMWLLDGSELTFRRMNRRQNELSLMSADPSSGTVRTILEEKEEAFINLHDDFILLDDNEHFLWSSERSGWRHLYLYDLQGTLKATLTSGDWAVGSITVVDQNRDWVYFTGSTEMGLETHFFRVKLDGSNLEKLTDEPGMHRISMDPAARYYTDVFSSFSTPTTGNMHTADGTLLNELLTTDTSRLDELELEPPELVIVKADDGTTDLHGILFKPAGYDPNQSYPLLVSVYGGPHSKSVRNSYSMNGYEQRYAQLGFMVWRMDNRGLTGRGKAFETETYLKLGQIDLADQTAGVQQITQRFYIDGSRIGVYGGSYGGYMTAMALLKESDVFHVGVAGAPVTDWRNYDTIYTERYMRTPQENPDGYDIGSALPYAGDLKGKLLLVHGSIDNNVHPGNTMQLVNALVDAQAQFDLMIYPGHRHGIRGNAGRHNSQLRIDYFIEHLDPPPYPWTR